MIHISSVKHVSTDALILKASSCRTCATAVCEYINIGCRSIRRLKIPPKMPGALLPMARWPLHSIFPLLLVTLLSLLVNVAHGAVSWTATPFNPAAVPLAVRTPYLSCWLPQGAGTALNGAWPTFWTGSVCGHPIFLPVYPLC